MMLIIPMLRVPLVTVPALRLVTIVPGLGATNQ
jgi:hypothetical protein